MGFIPGKGTYRESDNIRAGRLGILSIEGKVLKLTPLSGTYLPKINDRIIGTVCDVLMTGWRMETNSPYSAVMNLKDATAEFIPRGADLTQYFDIGDNVMCKIINVTSQRLVDITTKGPGLRKLEGGRIIKVGPQKIPRIIGKEGSMLAIIKESTGCEIQAGQNGLIWIQGEPEAEIKAAKAIKKIEEEAHKSGLTEKIKTLLQ